MKAPVLTWIGGAVFVAVAWPLSTFHSSPTIVDRAFPLLVLVLWSLASRTQEGSWRDLAYSLLPVAFAAELLVADRETRMLLIGAIVAASVAIHLWLLSERFRTSELLTALAIVIPVRIIEPSWQSVPVQGLFVAGSILLWREMRRAGTSPVPTAGTVLLLAVAIPAGSFRLSLVPWIVAGLVRAIRRESLIGKMIAIGVSVVAANWLAAASAVVVTAHWLTARLKRVEGPSSILPSLSTASGNLTAIALPLSFFPSLFSSIDRVAPVLATAVLAMFVRPSLAAPVVIVGIIAGAAAHTGGTGRIADVTLRGPAAENRLLELPSLVLVMMILLFLAWSGAIVARPPAPLPALVVLTVAAIALLPATFRVWSGFAGSMLVVAAVFSIPTPMEDRREIGRNLLAGESISIPLAGQWNGVDVQLAGANLADSRSDRRIATIEILDGFARGYARTVTIREAADWGAFRSNLVLETSNPRPDRFAGIEGFGLSSWIRGSGRIRLEGLSDPRWLVVTASSSLDNDEQIVVEEIGLR